MLGKMRQEIHTLDIEVEGFRDEGAIPAVFTRIHIHFIFSGKLKKEKVEKAIALSIGKYCSVSKMLEKSVEISSSFDIN
jgi:putative redox protein